MMNMRGMKWAVLAMCLFAAATAQAASWGTYTYNNITRGDGPWSMRMNGQTADVIYFDVGAGCNSITIETGTDGHGGSGNCDLYVRYGTYPTATSYLKRSVRANYKERIFLRKPPAGRYHVRLHGRSNYRTCLRLYVTKSGVDDHGLFVLRRANWERDIRGIRHLALNSRIEQAADAHAADMLQYGYYSHLGRTAATRTVAQRVANAGYPVRSAVENIGRTARYSNDQLDAWMRKSTTRANILNPYMRHFGFAWGFAGSDQRLVAVFARPR